MLLIAPFEHKYSLFLILYIQGNVRDSMILHINHAVESSTNVTGFAKRDHLAQFNVL